MKCLQALKGLAMKTRKAKASTEPTLLEQLSEPLRDFVNDFRQHGKNALEQVREKSPEKYLELSTKLLPLVAALNPGVNDFSDAKDMRGIGIALLKSVGCAEIDMDDGMITDALNANDAFIERLQAIRANAEGQVQ